MEKTRERLFPRTAVLDRQLEQLEELAKPELEQASGGARPPIFVPVYGVVIDPDPYKPPPYVPMYGVVITPPDDK